MWNEGDPNFRGILVKAETSISSAVSSLSSWLWTLERILNMHKGTYRLCRYGIKSRYLALKRSYNLSVHPLCMLHLRRCSQNNKNEQWCLCLGMLGAAETDPRRKLWLVSPLCLSNLDYYRAALPPSGISTSLQKQKPKLEQGICARARGWHSHWLEGMELISALCFGPQNNLPWNMRDDAGGGKAKQRQPSDTRCMCNAASKPRERKYSVCKSEQAEVWGRSQKQPAH